jgi:ABC-2 type transport system ATP-binding protein
VHKQKKRQQLKTVGVTLSHEDSNFDRQNQKLQCYHYTMRQSTTLPKKRGKGNTIFLIGKKTEKIILSRFFCIFAKYYSLYEDMSLSIQNVSKHYGSQLVLDNINIHLNAGEIVGFLGPNGAGKSTLMKIITGSIEADNGNVAVCGHKVSSNNLITKQLIGYLPEHNPLYLDMYVKEYLTFVAGFYDIKNKDKRVLEMIERTGLSNECHKKIGQLSKGYRQRVGLAQALIHNPQVLILDEPTTGLDPNQILEIRQLISDFGKDRTVLFSTHIMQEVQALCQRVIIINKGKIVADATESDITQKADNSLFEIEIKENITEQELAHATDKIVSIKKTADGKFELVATQDIRQDLFILATQNKWTILTLKQIEHSMEEIFRQLTNNE